MKWREHRMLRYRGRWFVQYRFLGLFWRTAHTHATLADAETRHESDEMVRWHLHTRREIERQTLEDFKAKG